MADVFDFYVRDNRKITFDIAEPIMREDSGVTDFRFHIPKTINGLDMSDWAWWFVFVNANKEKYSIALTLSDDPERPLEYNLATYTVDYAMSIKAGAVQFALEAINTGTGGAIDNEWHTLTYETKVKETLQGNQAEYAETESDIISALIQEVRTKMNQIIGGATPTPVPAVSAMTDTSKLYLLTTDGEWYYYNGSAWVSGGVYGAGIVDSVPTQGSTNAVSSGGVYSVTSALRDDVDALDSQINGTPVLTPYTKTVSDFYTQNFYIEPTTNKYVAGNRRGYFAPLGDTVKVSITGNSQNGSQYAFLSTDTCEAGADAPVVGSTSAVSISAGESIEVSVPSNARYLYFRSITGAGLPSFPDEITFYVSVAYGTSIVASIEGIKSDVSAINSASASDTGKLLRAKTITDGQVAEWEYAEIDPTLSKAESIADSKAVGDAIKAITGESETWLKIDNFELGSLYVSQGRLLTASNNTRIRTKPSAGITMQKGDVFGLNSYVNHRFVVFASADGATWEQGGWLTSNYTIPADGYYCFVVEDQSGTTHTSPDELFSLVTLDISDTSIIGGIKRQIATLADNAKTPKFAHLSFDDVQYCMMDLQTNADTYTSIFDNPFFAMLKDLHDTYGAVVSLYLFLTNSMDGISGYPDKFAVDFTDNADWLKFGLHQGGSNYASTTAQTALTDYNTFTSNIVRIAGTVDAIDRCPRLGNFAGNSDSMLAMRDADAGIVGLLSAYDTRNSYYLSSADSAFVYKHGRLYDTVNRLTFFRSLMAMEAQAPTNTLPPLRTLAGVNGSDYAILMMHEYGVYGSDYVISTPMKDRLVYACNFAKQNGYVWDFPMNRIIR